METNRSKIKRAVLHIGPDKTGSTAIQRTFRDNSDFFESSGVYYSNDYSHNDKGLFLWFCSDADLARAIVKAPRSSQLRLIDRYKKAFRERLVQMAPGATWVFSHEGLIYLQKDDLQALKNYLLEFAYDVRIVFYVRDALSYAISAKSQFAKTGRCNSWIKPRYIQYAEALPKFVEVFGVENVEARLFDKSNFKCGDVFLDFINANWAEGVFSKIRKLFKTSFQPNLSLDADSYLLLHSLARTLHGTDVSSAEFRKNFSRYLTHTGPALKLSPVEALLVLVLSRKHYSYIRRTFGVEPKVRLSRHVGFSICRHFMREVQAQAIVVNGPFPQKPGVLLKLMRLAVALFHDALLFPFCLTREIMQKKYRIK